MITLILYQLEDCSYCAKVRKKLDQKKLDYTTVNVPQTREDPLRRELFRKSGIPIIPVLKITTKKEEKYIGESEVIIAYVEKNL